MPRGESTGDFNGRERNDVAASAQLALEVERQRQRWRARLVKRPRRRGTVTPPMRSCTR
jgi:hypothetical protein